MKYGIWCKGIKDWMVESKQDIALWDSEKEATKFMKDHLYIHKDTYEVRRFDKPSKE
jgi:hypothetical protein